MLAKIAKNMCFVLVGALIFVGTFNAQVDAQENAQIRQQAWEAKQSYALENQGKSGIKEELIQVTADYDWKGLVERTASAAPKEISTAFGLINDILDDVAQAEITDETKAEMEDACKVVVTTSTKIAAIQKSAAKFINEITDSKAPKG